MPNKKLTIKVENTTISVEIPPNWTIQNLTASCGLHGWTLRRPDGQALFAQETVDGLEYGETLVAHFTADSCGK
jgi:hypothetical protein